MKRVMRIFLITWVAVALIRCQAHDFNNKQQTIMLDNMVVSFNLPEQLYLNLSERSGFYLIDSSHKELGEVSIGFDGYVSLEILPLPHNAQTPTLDYYTEKLASLGGNVVFSGNCNVSGFSAFCIRLYKWLSRDSFPPPTDYVYMEFIYILFEDKIALIHMKINDKYRGGEFEKAYESWLESIEISLEK